MKKPVHIATVTFDSPLGLVRVAASPKGVCGVWFEGQRHQPDASTWPIAANHPLLQQARTQLTEYFAGLRRQFDLPLDLSAGTPFQQAVWQALLALPCGHTTTYAALSQSIGRPSAVRAVAAAAMKAPGTVASTKVTLIPMR